MKPGRLRIQRVIEDNIGLVLSACLVFLLLGGYVAYTTHVDPGVETERSQLSSWSSTAELTHEAAVTGNTSAFPDGAVLQDRTSYLTEVMPVADVALEYTYRATEDGELDIESTQTVVTRSAEERQGTDVEYWRIEEPLATGSASDVGPGETVNFPFSLDILDRIAGINDVEQELGGTPGSTELLVRTELVISGVLNDETVTERYTYETRIAIEGNVYRFDGTGPYEEGAQQFTEREVEATYGPLRSAAGPALLVLGALGGVAVVAGRSTGGLAVSQTEREWLAYRATYREYEAWISTGHVADTALPSSRVTLDSLDGLVDVAIDSNRRVIHDRERGCHLVVVDETLYTYDPPASPSRLDSSLAVSEETTQQSSPTGSTGDSTADELSSHTATDADERSGTEGATGDSVTQQDSDADRSEGGSNSPETDPDE